MLAEISLLAIVAAWPTYHANNQRTGVVSGTSQFTIDTAFVYSAWKVYSDTNLTVNSPLLWDMDSDGKEDVFVGSNFDYPTIAVFRVPGPMQVDTLWSTSQTQDAYYATGALMDVTGDGIPEVFWPMESATRGAEAYNGATGNMIWSADIGSWGGEYGSPLCYTDAGTPKVLMPSEDYMLYCFNAADGSQLWRFEGYDWDFYSYGSPAMGDINGNGTDEIVWTSESRLYILDLAGNELQRFTGMNVPSTPVLADLDASRPGLEIVVFNGGNGRLDIYGYNSGSSQWEQLHSVNLQSNQGDDLTLPPCPAVGDVDNDGDLEIVMDGSGTVYCLDDQLNTVWQTSIPVGNLYGAPVMADLDGDGRLEIVVTGGRALGNGEVGIIYFLDDDGTINWSWSDETLTHYPIDNEATLGDVDGDGYLEIVVLDYSCYVVILDYEEPLYDAIGETGNLAGLDFKLRGQSLYLYMPSQGPAELSLYDASGRLVDKLFNGVLPAGSHVFSLDPTAKGVYFAVLKTQNQTKTVKIAY